MKFSEKLKNAREEAGLTQAKLAKDAGIALRTLQNWENGVRHPSRIDAVQKVAAVLGMNAAMLLSDEESFLLQVGENYGSRGKKGAEKLLTEISGLFSGGEMAQEDKDQFMLAVQEAYILAKRKNKKFTPKKYRSNGEE